MGNWLEQVLKLLSTETGGLTYHLVLSFSVAGALQLVLNQGARGAHARWRRTLLGLGILLALQLTLFAVSGLSWQGILSGEQVLPPLDRAFSLLSLIVIVWLWCYPDPSPLEDSITLLLGVIAVAAAVMGVLWWPAQPVDLAFNRSPADVSAQLISLALLLIGVLSLLARQPEAWGYGLSMFITLAVGIGLHLLMLPTGGDYPLPIRLCQMIAYPFLLLLAQRFPVEVEQDVAQVAEAPGASTMTFPAESGLPGSPQIWQTLQKLAAESDPQQLARGITAFLAENMDADFCLLLTMPDAGGRILIRSAYDRNAKRYLEAATLDSRALPTLNSAIRMGRTRRLPGSSAAPDLIELARALAIETTGNLLLSPVLAPDGHPIASLLLLSPASGKDWNPDEIAAAGIMGKLLVQFLQRSQEMISLEQDLAQSRQNVRLAQEQAQQAVEERQKLRDQLAVLQENTQRDHLQLVTLTAVSAEHNEVQQTLAELKAENDRLKEAAHLTEQSLKQKAESLDGELRLTLEEIAMLRASLSEADEIIESTKLAQPETNSSDIQLEAISLIAQDLRQPLSSIVGYTDFLLGETIGILGTSQRRYLERIRISTDRINRLIEDLMQMASPESNAMHLEFKEVDVCQILQRAVTESNPAMSEKRIALHLDLPAKPLCISSDRHALRKVFGQMVKNAGTVTPQGGSVLVKARFEAADNNQDYVLVQVADSGGGIAPQDLLNVFSPQSDDHPIQGLAKSGPEISRMKVLIEALGGRTWVDSEVGNGATFSVLLPVKALVESGNGRSEWA
jgi:signal transduction histidine kinase